MNVHYIPIHLHPYYCGSLDASRTCKPRNQSLCPVAEEAYGRIISLPMFPAMTDTDVAMVVETLKNVFKRF